MSKGVKLLILGGAVLLIGGWAGWMLWPKRSSEFAEKEINIQQAEIPAIENVVYTDWAGFSFEHPDNLTIEELEVDDKTVYSSLELTAVDEKKLTLKIANSRFKDLEAWKESFEAVNVVISLRDVYWVDIPGLQVVYGAPKKLLTVAVEDGVLYQLESPTDEGGFWDETHQLILNSFEFAESVMVNEETEVQIEEETGKDIILLEEEIIE